MSYKAIWNSIIAFIGTGLTYLFGGWDLTISALIIFIVLDYITGLMRAYKEKELSSSIGFNGLLRKAAIMIIIIIAVQLDRVLGFESPTFRTLCCMFYLANEGISITENIAMLGVDMPKGVVDALKKPHNHE